MTGPLSGLRILEVGGVGPVPFCGMVLSDLGADVISIGRPPGPTGASDEVTTDAQGLLSRGRRSVAVDLKHPDGVATVLAMVEKMDGLMEGYRPGVMERLGLSPDLCLRTNPRLVYGRMTGWGQRGPYAHLPGHDINYLALSGALASIGERSGPPIPPLNLVADFGGGSMLLALGMLAGLFETARSGQGQVVDAAMIDGSSLLMTMMYELLGRGSWVEERGSNINDSGAPFYACYETADGKYVAIGAMERRFFAELVDRIGLRLGDLPDQWDRAQWPLLKETLADTFRRRTRDEWCALLDDAPVCFTPVLTMSEAVLHPHNVERNTFDRVADVAQPAPAPRFSRTPGAAGQPPAGPGADTDEVLAELGFPPGQIARLRSVGAIA